MESNLCDSVQALIDQGRGEVHGDLRFLPLVTLDSDARVGLDARCRWILIPAQGAPTAVEPDTVYLLHEALEWKRSRFEESLAEASRALGLPPDEIVFSFPAVALVRAILAKQSSYLTRLALHWLLPSERRELREPLIAVTRDPTMPGPVRDLASRLVVPPD